MEILDWKRSLILFCSFPFHCRPWRLYPQGDTQFLSKTRGDPSLVSVGAGTGRTCMGNILLPNSMLLHHVITGKMNHQHLPVA